MSDMSRHLAGFVRAIHGLRSRLHQRRIRQRRRQTALPSLRSSRPFEGLEPRILLSGSGFEGTIFQDLNSDGDRTGDPGVPYAVVEVFQSSNAIVGDGDDISVGIFQTDASGQFSTTSLSPGNYYLAVRPPVNYFSFTTTNVDSQGGSSAMLTLDGINPVTQDVGVNGSTPQFGFAAASNGSLIEKASGVAVDFDGNVIVTGSFQGSFDADSGPGQTLLTSVGGEDIFVASYSPTGALRWAHAFGSTGDDRGVAIALSPFGQAHVIGSFRGTVDFDPDPSGDASLTSVASSDDVFVLRLNTTGHFEYVNSLGGSSNDTPADITVNSDGAAYITGDFIGTAAAGVHSLTAVSGSRDMFVAQVNADGTFQWAGAMGGSQGDTARTIVHDGDGWIYLGGWFNNFNKDVDLDPSSMTSLANSDGTGGIDAFYVSLDAANGKFNFAQVFAGAGSEEISDLAVIPGGGLVMVGRYENTLDFAPGQEEHLLTAAGTHLFAASYDQLGELVFAVDLGATGSSDVGPSLAVDSRGMTFIASNFTGTVDVDPGPGVRNLTQTGVAADGFITTLDPLGNLLSVAQISSTGQVELRDLTLNIHNDVYYAGAFTKTADFDPGAGLFELSSNSDTIDSFVSVLRSAKVFARAWADFNADGVQDPDEPGLPGVLFDVISVGADDIAGTEDDLAAGSIFTDIDGSGYLGHLPAGRYFLEYYPNDQFEVGPLDQGADDSDSDIDPSTFFSPAFDLTAGQWADHTGVALIRVASQYEQYMLELINRARANPDAEAARYSGDLYESGLADLNEGLDPGTISSTPKQPLAFNARLAVASYLHAWDMLSNSFFDHLGSDQSAPHDRMVAAGYLFSPPPAGSAENLAYAGGSEPFDYLAGISLVEQNHANLFVDAGILDRGHRVNLMNDQLMEVGVSISSGHQFLDAEFAQLVVQNFAYQSQDRFLTGVVYVDGAALGVEDDFYSPSEGLGDVTITAVRDADELTLSTQTSRSGGYQLQLPPGTYTVVATGGLLSQPIEFESIVIASENVKLDFTPQGGGSISGVAFYDMDGDGVWEQGEQELSDAEIYLDFDFDGHHDDDEPMTRTGPDGSFYFDGLPSGEYVVRQHLQNGYELTLPTSITFAREVHELDQFHPHEFVIADFTGDNVKDLITRQNGALVLIDGDTRIETQLFAGDFTTLLNHRLFDAGDLDGDGDLDLLAVEDPQGVFVGDTPVMHVLINDGAGHFAPQKLAGTSYFDSPVLTDLNGDDIADLLIIDGADATVYLNLTQANTSFAGFDTPVFVSSGSNSNLQRIAAADVKGDSNIEVILAKSGDSNVAAEIVIVARNGGAYDTFSSIPLGLDVTITSDIIAADLDDDGDLDLVVAVNASGAPELRIVRNDAGSLTLLSAVATPVSAHILTAGDLDGDGVPELLVGDSSNLYVLPHDGAFTFATPIPFDGVNRGNSNVDFFFASIIDTDDDGVPELAVSNASHTENPRTIVLYHNVTGGYTVSLSQNGSLSGLQFGSQFVGLPIDETAPESPQPVQTHTLDLQPGAEFGFPLLALDSNTFVAAARGGDSGNGAIYIVDLDSGIVNTIVHLNPAALGDNLRLGDSIALLSDNRLIVGAESAQVGQHFDAGAVFVFDLITGDLLLTIENPAPGDDDAFGVAVASVGEFILIGADLNTVDSYSEAGTIYIYDDQGTLLQTIDNPTPDSRDQFGYSLATADSSHVLVGVPEGEFDEPESASGPGRVVLMDLDGNVVRTLTSPAGQTGDLFGTQVSTIGSNLVLIGAPGDDTFGPDAGAAYLFDWSTGQLLATLHNPDPVELEGFGNAVTALSPDLLFVGALQDDEGDADLAGRGYLFDIQGNHLLSFTADTPRVGDGFGAAAALVGPDQLLVGSPWSQLDAPFGGAVYQFDLSALMGSIAGSIYAESDANGIQDGAVIGIVGVNVELWTVSDEPELIASTTTDSFGAYSFVGMPPGDYTVYVDTPSGRRLSPADQGFDDSLDSDFDPATGQTATVSLTFGQQIGHVDALMYFPAAVGDFVWDDLNGNGLQESGEQGLGNVLVTLLDSVGNVLDSILTDTGGVTPANLGRYVFEDLAPGDYQLRFDLPPGYAMTYPSLDGDTELDSNPDVTTLTTELFTLASGDSITDIDAGLVQRGTLGGVIFDDTNLNGSHDGSESGLNVTVKLIDQNSSEVIDATTTIAGGAYQFNNVRPGQYTIEYLAPAGDLGLASPINVTLAPGEQLLDHDFAVVFAASINVNVFHDLDGDGIRDAGETPFPAGVTVSPGLGAQLIDANGDAIFTGITPDNATGYSITIDAGQAALLSTTLPDPVLLESGEHASFEVGVYVPGSIAGRIFEDLDANSSQGQTESGQQGWIVYLDQNNNAARDQNEPFVTSDANGDFVFNNLAPDTYVLRQELQSGWVQTTPPAAAHTIALTSGSNVSNRTFGNTQSVQPGAIVGSLFDDSNGDGVRNPGEPGLANVRVYIDTDQDNQFDAEELSTFTDANGLYRLTSLTPGSYRVATVQPDRVITQPDNVTYRDVLVPPGQTATDNDFGSYSYVVIYGTSFSDLNRNSRRNGNEPALANQTIYLDQNNNSQLDDGEPTAVTNDRGLYSFDASYQLAPGTYRIRHVLEAGSAHSVPAGDVHEVTLTSGRGIEGINFGILPPESLGDIRGWFSQVGISSQFTPGDRSSATLMLENVGQARSAGAINIDLYLATDDDIAQGVGILIGRFTRSVNLASGQTQELVFNFALPNNIDLTEYHLVADIDPFNSLPESDETNNEAITSDTYQASLQFGTLDNRNVRLKLDNVSFQLSGPGVGHVSPNEDGSFDITLDGVNSTTVLIINPPAGDDARLRNLTVNGSLRSLQGQRVNLEGDICITGSIAQLTLNQVDDDHEIDIGHDDAIASVMMRFGQVRDTVINSQTPISYLSAIDWIDCDDTADAINAPWLGLLQTTGSAAFESAGHFQADLNLCDPDSRLPLLNVAQIAGDLTSACWNIDGNVNSILVRGQAENWSLSVGANLNSLNVSLISCTDIEIDGMLRVLTSQQWDGGSLSANQVSSINITGRPANEIAGDFLVDLDLCGYDVSGLVLNSIRIAGSVYDADWSINGHAGSVMIGGEASDWSLEVDGNLNQLRLGDVRCTDVEIDGRLNTLIAYNWNGGMLEAAALGSMQIVGSAAHELAGDFRADLTLTGQPGPGLTFNSILLRGSVDGADWHIGGSGGSLIVQGELDDFDLCVDGNLNLLNLNHVHCADVSIDGSLNSLTTRQWSSGQLTADAIRSLRTLAYAPSELAGDFHADLTLRGASTGLTLGSAYIAGDVESTCWKIQGSAGSLMILGDIECWELALQGSVSVLRTGLLDHSQLDIADHLTTLQATRIRQTSITAQRINSLQTLGNRLREIDGEFSGELTLSHTGSGAALNQLLLQGDLYDARIRSAGSVGVVTARSIQNSLLFAGVSDDVTQLPTSLADFVNPLAEIRSINTPGQADQPALVNSMIAAARLGSINLRLIETDNDGTELGLAAHHIKSLTARTPQGTLRLTNLDTAEDSFSEGDFTVNIADEVNQGG